MVSALSAKFAQGQLTIVDALDCLEAKTKEAVAMSNKFNWEDGGALIIGGEQVNPKFRMATSNLHHLEVQAHSGLNVYAVLKRKHLVISKDALELLDRHVTL
jgi:large subunit ribosomal protein L4